MPDGNIEIWSVQHLTALTGLAITNICGAQSVFGHRELGIDVVANFNGEQIGIQHTLLHPDEGRVPGKRGSFLRAQEEAVRKLALSPQPMWGVVDCRPALGMRIGEKIAVAEHHDNRGLLSRTWLLVSAGIYLSTMVIPGMVTVDEMDRLFHQSLAGSNFDEAFFVLHAQRIVYGWNRKNRWRVLADPDGAERERHRTEMCDLIFNQLPKFHRGQINRF